MKEKYFIRTFGCKTNQYESQLIKELLSQRNKIVTEEYCEADFVVINSCAVTQPAERDVYKFIRRVYNENKNIKKFFLIGCYSEYIEQRCLYNQFFGRLSVKIPIEFIGNAKKYSFIEKDICDINCGIKKFFGEKRAYLKIQDGCDNFCSYCVVPYLRNKILSKPLEIVIKEVKDLIINKYYEIYLVGTNIGKYNYRGLDYIDLSEEILKNFPYITLIFSSLNPSDLKEKFFEFLERNRLKIFPHFHIALQSPLDEILEDMNRDYTFREFLEKVNRLRKVIPNAIISSDIIVGYPLETKQKFEKVLEILKKTNLNWYHVFPYSPRVGTKSYMKYGEFGLNDAKLRVRRLNELSITLGEKYFKELCKVK